MEIFVDSLYDAILDCLKVVPILFLAYLLVSIFSHDHNHKFSSFLSKNKRTSVLYASFLGCVPQCGFSSVIADLYSEKHVSLGTLVAVFVATSDEALPIMLSNTNKILDMLLLIAVKVMLALFWGYTVDLATKLFARKHESQHEILHDHHHEHHHGCGHVHCEHCDTHCGHEHGECCANNIFLDAFGHTFGIVIYIFVATFLLNIVVGYCNMDALATFLQVNPYLQIILASLIGLVPNCASSVFLVELFMLETPLLSFPALVAGLTSGAGVGLFILWARNKKHLWQNLGIVFLQYAIGVLSGLFLLLFF